MGSDTDPAAAAPDPDGATAAAAEPPPSPPPPPVAAAAAMERAASAASAPSPASTPASSSPSAPPSPPPATTGRAPSPPSAASHGVRRVLQPPQKAALERAFAENQRPGPESFRRIAEAARLPVPDVKRWFRNRRHMHNKITQAVMTGAYGMHLWPGTRYQQQQAAAQHHQQLMGGPLDAAGRPAPPPPPPAVPLGGPPSPWIARGGLAAPALPQQQQQQSQAPAAAPAIPNGAGAYGGVPPGAPAGAVHAAADVAWRDITRRFEWLPAAVCEAVLAPYEERLRAARIDAAPVDRGLLAGLVAMFVDRPDYLFALLAIASQHRDHLPSPTTARTDGAGAAATQPPQGPPAHGQAPPPAPAAMPPPFAGATVYRPLQADEAAAVAALAYFPVAGAAPAAPSPYWSVSQHQPQRGPPGAPAGAADVDPQLGLRPYSAFQPVRSRDVGSYEPYAPPPPPPMGMHAPVAGMYGPPGAGDAAGGAPPPVPGPAGPAPLVPAPGSVQGHMYPHPNYVLMTHN